MATDKRTRLALSITPKIYAQLETISGITGETISAAALRVLLTGLGHAVGQAKASAHGYRPPIVDGNAALLARIERLEALLSDLDPREASQRPNMPRAQRRQLEKLQRKGKLSPC